METHVPTGALARLACPRAKQRPLFATSSPYTRRIQVVQPHPPPSAAPSNQLQRAVQTAHSLRPYNCLHPLPASAACTHSLRPRTAGLQPRASNARAPKQPVPAPS